MDITNDDANFTLLIVIATGHHGPHCVIHHSHNVGIVILGTDNRASPPLTRGRKDHNFTETVVFMATVAPAGIVAFVPAGTQINWIE